MSMSKQDFIALADAIRELTPPQGTLCEQCHKREAVARGAFGSLYCSQCATDSARSLRLIDIGSVITCLADFCQSQNPRFMRDRWLGYIAGTCGKNGGSVRKVA